jgi:hypothetical protein
LDQASTTGDGIDETCEAGSEEQEDDDFEGEIHQEEIAQERSDMTSVITD